MLQRVFAALSPPGERARLSAFIFHRVLAEADPLLPDEPDAARFERICAWIGTWFNVIPLGEAVARLAEGNLPERAAAITFDDGYRDNRTIALPILRRLGLPAAFFISTGFLGGGRLWNDTVIEAIREFGGLRLDLRHLGLGVHEVTGAERRTAVIVSLLGRVKRLPPAERVSAVNGIEAMVGRPLADGLMMTADDVRSLRAAGMTIGAHTVSHPILTRLEPAQARAEIEQSKADLETILGGERIDIFAYPNGVPGVDYAQEHVRMVEEAGFRAAFSTAWGAASAGADRFQLPRFTPWDRSRLRFGLRLMRNLRLA